MHVDCYIPSWWVVLVMYVDCCGLSLWVQENVIYVICYDIFW